MTSAEIVFVGLCTILNATHGTSADLPAPAAVLVRVDGKSHANHGVDIPEHVAFIAYDTRDVQLTGVTDLELKGTTYRYVLLEGEELAFGEAPAGKTRLKPSFATVPHRSEYWKNGPPPKWNRCIAPIKGRKAAKECVAAYMPLGGGDLSAGHLTLVEWSFRETSESPALLRDRFAREVYYRFPLKTAQLVLTATTLDAERRTRTLTFTGRTSAQDVRVWIGNTPRSFISTEIAGLEPLEYTGGEHFAALSRISTDGDTFPMPHPSTAKVPVGGLIGDAPSDRKNPQGGYCGPDGEP